METVDIITPVADELYGQEQAIEGSDFCEYFRRELRVAGGAQVAEELRKSPETSNCVIIAITGYGQASDRERALQSGFDFHLVKPAEPTQVLRMIDDALQHRNESSATD